MAEEKGGQSVGNPVQQGNRSTVNNFTADTKKDPHPGGPAAPEPLLPAVEPTNTANPAAASPSEPLSAPHNPTKIYADAEKVENAAKNMNGYLEELGLAPNRLPTKGDLGSANK